MALVQWCSCFLFSPILHSYLTLLLEEFSVLKGAWGLRHLVTSPLIRVGGYLSNLIAKGTSGLVKRFKCFLQQRGNHRVWRRYLVDTFEGVNKRIKLPTRSFLPCALIAEIEHFTIAVMTIDAGTCGSTNKFGRLPCPWVPVDAPSSWRKLCLDTLWTNATKVSTQHYFTTHHCSTSLRNDIEHCRRSNGDDFLSYTYTDYTNRPSASFPQSSNSTMPALPVPQSDWSNNVYVVVTTRVFVMVGMAYLIKSLYHLLPSNWGTRSASIAAGRLSLASNPDLYTQEVWRSNNWHSLVIG